MEEHERSKNQKVIIFFIFFCDKLEGMFYFMFKEIITDEDLDNILSRVEFTKEIIELLRHKNTLTSEDYENVFLNSTDWGKLNSAAILSGEDRGELIDKSRERVSRIIPLLSYTLQENGDYVLQ